MPWGDETPGVDTEGNGVTGQDGWGQVGYGNPPTTRASADSVNDGGNDSMVRGPRTVAPPCPSGTVADNNSAGALPQQSEGADGSRTEIFMHLCRKYGLLSPEELDGVRSNAGPRSR